MDGSIDFFLTPAAPRLDEPSNHPSVIARFLGHERWLVHTLLTDVERLVEVACGTGRYLDLADSHGVAYHGIDISPTAVMRGRERLASGSFRTPGHRFDLGAVESLGAHRRLTLGGGPLERSLVLLPFSVLSAVADLDAAARSLAHQGRPFLATMYGTSDEMTQGRVEYYRRCGYRVIAVEKDAVGVCVSTADGLTTTAYEPEVLEALWARHKMRVKTVTLHDGFVCTGTCRVPVAEP